mgnify:CR=1 FL=1
MEAIRLDKYLWAVRIFKTRSDAAEAIRQNRVLVNDAYAKPSREVRIGDRIAVKRMPVTYLFEVVGYVSSRPRTSPTTVATSLRNRNSTSSTSPAKRSSSSATGVRDVQPKRSGASWTALWRRYIWKKRKSNQRNIILIGQ